MEIPKTLVELARAKELDTTSWEWTWTQKDNCTLYATPTGKKLVLLFGDKKKQVRWPENQKIKGLGRGKRLFSDFSAFKADKTTRYKIKDRKITNCGKALSIVYHSDKWDGKGRLYIHEFEARPAVYCDDPAQPSIILLSGSKLRVTARGIVG